MWGAIIQAIDHAMGRTQKGMSSGIEVAGNQNGGAAGSVSTGGESNFSSGANIADAIKESKSEENDESSKIDIGDNATSTGEESGGSSSGGGAGLLSGAGDIMGGAGEAGAGAGAAEGAAAIASDEELKAKRCASSVRKNWHRRGQVKPMEDMNESITSDKNLKDSSNVSSEGGKAGNGDESKSGWFSQFLQKSEPYRKYAANLSKSITNAAAVATGNKPENTDSESVDWSTIKNNFSGWGSKTSDSKTDTKSTTGTGGK